ncbi:STM3941 family protein [Pararhizobium sp.]|uniref:STM3941 family protein n=1 Tax=Pararhizobium sp. TaxID=1977563 RepID=UPI0027165B4C|nr:STM3941 family protein [Pararhizobium sp.]MDO9417921.1 STM3941 family protein [Pararhizobium sp.]
MDVSQETVIERSRSKTLLIFLGSAVFVALGVWLLTLTDESLLNRYNELFLRGMGLASILLFGIFGVIALKKLFETGPALVLSPQGILDASSGVSAGFVPWSDITASSIFTIRNQKILVIHVADPEPYIRRHNALMRFVARQNLAMCGSPVTISATSLKISFDTLCETFKAYAMAHVPVR